MFMLRMSPFSFKIEETKSVKFTHAHGFPCLTSTFEWPRDFFVQDCDERTAMLIIARKD